MEVEIRRPLFKGSTFIATKMSRMVEYENCIVVATCRIVEHLELPSSEHSFRFDDKCEDPESKLGLVLFRFPDDVMAFSGSFFIVVEDNIYMIHRTSVVGGRLDRYIGMIQKIFVMLFLSYIALILWPLFVRIYKW